MSTKTYRAVTVGQLFPQAGWYWTIVEVAPNGRKFWATTPKSDRDPSLMRREFSAEIGVPYYGEPDPEPSEED